MFDGWALQSNNPSETDQQKHVLDLTSVLILTIPWLSEQTFSTDGASCCQAFVSAMRNFSYKQAVKQLQIPS